MAVWDDPAVTAGIRAQGRLLQERLDAGGTLAGWKIGFGSPVAMERLGIEAPLVGFVVSVLDSGSTVSLDGWTKPAFEPEIAIHLGRDLDSGATRAEAAAAISALGPAIELADLDGPLDDVEGIVGANIRLHPRGRGCQRHRCSRALQRDRGRCHRRSRGVDGQSRRPHCAHRRLAGCGGPPAARRAGDHGRVCDTAGMAEAGGSDRVPVPTDGHARADLRRLRGTCLPVV